MVRQELMLRNPLRMLGTHTGSILPEGGFGAIVARAGVGKTSLLVQIALDRLLRNEGVLHISLEDPVQKVLLWYDEIFQNIALKHGITQNDVLWDHIRSHRFIMTFHVDSFSVPKLEERMVELTEQRIIDPAIIMVDGLPAGEQVGEVLYQLKDLAEKYEQQIWFSIRSNQINDEGKVELPATMQPFANLFDMVLRLSPQNQEVHVEVAKGQQTESDLILDPATMLLKDLPIV